MLLPAFLLLLPLVVAFNCPNTTKPRATLWEIRSALNDYNEIFYGQKDAAVAFNKYVALDLIQHNPGVPDGRQADIATLGPLLSSPSTFFDVKESMLGTGSSGDILAAVHVNATFADGSYAAVDIYRFIGTCIVEHWDVLELQEGGSVNTHPYF